jgi:hypothetical protein
MSLIRLFAFLALSLPALAESARPNILWLIAEDFGPHLGCYGTKEVTTPVLDAMAAKGMRSSAERTIRLLKERRSALISAAVIGKIAISETTA